MNIDKYSQLSTPLLNLEKEPMNDYECGISESKLQMQFEDNKFIE